MRQPIFGTITCMKNRATITQMLRYLIEGMKGQQMTKLYLLKAVYLADRYHLRKDGRLISRANYVAMPLGPVPSEVKSWLEHVSRRGANGVDGLFAKPIGNRLFAFESSKKHPCSWDCLSETDREALDAVIRLMKERVATKDLVAYTHNFPEWKRHEGELTPSHQSVKMEITDFFLPADPKVEYCDADDALVAMNLDYYCNPF